MTVRLPRVMRTLAGITAGLFVLTSALTAQPPDKPAKPAPPATPTTADPAASTSELGAKQAEIQKNFTQFKEALFRLATRLEKSEQPGMKDQAKVIRQALDEVEKKGVDGQFAQLVAGIAKSTTAPEFGKLEESDKQLVATLQAIMALLEVEGDAARLKAEKDRLEAIMKELKGLIETQKSNQARVESNKGDLNKLKTEQDRLKDAAKDLADRMGKDGKDGAGGAKKDDRAEGKAEPKGGEKAGDGKGDTAEAKGEGKEPKGDGKEGKEGAGEGKGEGKDGKEGKEGAGQGKGEGKEGKEGAGEGKGEGKGDGKEGSGKEGKEGDGQGKPSDGKGDGKEGAGKPGEGKEGGKEGAGKPGEGQGKPGDSAKPGDGKGQGEGKGQGKPSDGGGKPSDGAGKPGEGQGQGKGQGEGKGGGKGSEGKGQGGEGKGSGKEGGMPPQGGQPGGGKPGGQPGGGQPGGGQPPPGGDQKNDTPGRKEIQEAIPHQGDASKKIEEDKRAEAGKKQDQAIDSLEKAMKKLEERLKQLREEEIKKLLANVEARCNKMLAMQIDVYENTKTIDAARIKNGGEMTNIERQKSGQQSDKEGEIVAEAERCMKLLESEGSAVAFAKVLEEVRQDMIAIQRRLNSSVVDKDTQSIEENVIAMLKEMVEALKKQQKDMEKPPPMPGQPGQPPKPPNQKLIDLIAELKLIRSLQSQVNMRTKMYGDKEKAEQSKDENIQKELRQLAARQAKLQEMIDKIASGENEK